MMDIGLWTALGAGLPTAPGAGLPTALGGDPAAAGPARTPASRIRAGRIGLIGVSVRRSDTPPVAVAFPTRARIRGLRKGSPRARLVIRSTRRIDASH